MTGRRVGVGDVEGDGCCASRRRRSLPPGVPRRASPGDLGGHCGSAGAVEVLGWSAFLSEGKGRFLLGENLTRWHRLDSTTERPRKRKSEVERISHLLLNRLCSPKMKAEMVGCHIIDRPILPPPCHSVLCP